MSASVAQSNPSAISRERVTRVLLWVSVFAWGLLLGAALFDLRVLAGAWRASPPESLALLPYGKRWPANTGEFYIASSAALFFGDFRIAAILAISIPYPATIDNRPSSLLMKAFYTACIVGVLTFVVYFVSNI